MNLPENEANNECLLNTDQTVSSELARTANDEPQTSRQKTTIEIYRAADEFRASNSDMNINFYQTQLANGRRKDLQAVPICPPSYSTVMKLERSVLDIRREVRSMEMQCLNSFVRIPPPSYADIRGVESRELDSNSSEHVILGPDPAYIWCARCGTVVMTMTHSERSKFTHLSAAALCLFGCWPCALLPYVMNSCKNIYHFCPDCNYFFGIYRPW